MIASPEYYTHAVAPKDLDPPLAPAHPGLEGALGGEAEPTPRVAVARLDLARRIDHTLLAPQTGREALYRHCQEAVDHAFYSVCVASRNVGFCAERLAGTGIRVCSVVAFPHGDASTAAKRAEAARAVQDGADELDVVLALGSLRDGDHRAVVDDLRAVVAAAAERPVKVILETVRLDERQIVVACALSQAAGAAFVKTSTGYGGGGATVDDVALMRSVVGPHVAVKASGGIRDAAGADALLAAGATRLGASRSIAIVGGAAVGGGEDY